MGLTTRSLLFVWQLRSYSCGAPSLTRGRVCLLYMLLALASAAFLGSESLGTSDHILLSHIWDFPFRRLLLGSLLYSSGADPTENTVSHQYFYCWALIRCRRNVFTQSFHSKGSTHYIPFPTIALLLRIAQPLPSNGCFSASTVLA
jgi:hypothetical protein